MAGIAHLRLASQDKNGGNRSCRIYISQRPPSRSIRPPRSFAASRATIETALPIAAYMYFDQCEFSARRLSGADERNLEKRGFDVRCHEERRRSDGMRFTPPGSKLSIAVHDRMELLSFLAGFSGVTPSAVEIALDIIYADELTAEAVMDAMTATIAQPWAGDRDVVTIDNSTYTGQRKKGRHHHWGAYVDKPCRITGEVACAHLENRHVTPQLLRKIGIDDVTAMLDFDFAAFFQERLSGLFLHVDLTRLGRVHFNKRVGARRHKERVDE
jgi:hypothetical protein